MPHDVKRLHRLGGAALVASGLLFLSRAILDRSAGAPPSTGVEVLAWIASNSLALKFDSEILFFAALCLVPGLIALYQSLADVDRVKAAIGCGVVAVVIPVLAATLVVHGRLMYPVYGIRATTPDVAALVVAVFYGGMHAIYLLLAVGTLVLSLAMTRRAYGRPTAYLGFVTAVVDVIAAYPDAIGPTLTMVSQGFVAAWFVVVGGQLYRMRVETAAA